MSQIFLYGFITGFSLLAGAALGILLKFKQKTIANFMAFGSGVLICALTFGLMEEAFRHGGFDAIIIGFLLGGVIFLIGDYFIIKSGGKSFKRHRLSELDQKKASGKAITMGAILDGIPESIALGIAVANNAGTGLLVLIAIVLSNLPEGISSITGLKLAGFSKQKIYGLWALVGLVVFTVVVLSFKFLPQLDPNNIGILEAFAGGAILAMLASNLMPEAYEEGGLSVGMATVLGFLVAFIVSRF